MAHVAEPAGLPGSLRGLGRALVMGVLNVTPDSFSDGGRFLDPDAGIARGLALRDAGADLVDVGGESTRPGASRVPVEEELHRVLPVVTALAAEGVPVSIDTMRAEVAEQALAAGAVVVNDVSGGLADPSVLRVVAQARVPYVVMHWRGPSTVMDDLARYGDVVHDVRVELARRLDGAMAAGVDPAYVVLDPGLGFAKDARHNWALLAHLDQLGVLGRPLLVGASRKRFLGSLLGGSAAPPPPERDPATAAVSALAAGAGVWCVRVHEPAASRDAVLVAAAWRDAALERR
ncbi:MAG TPA: dihydropteroate synthase [Actinomycetes bacterium]